MAKRKKPRHRRGAFKKRPGATPKNSDAMVEGAEPRRTPTVQMGKAEVGWRERRLWPIVVSILGTLGATAVITFTPLFDAKLQLVSLPPVISFPEMNANPAEVRTLLRARFCVQNRGFRSGSISRVAVNPAGLARIPHVQVINLDHAPIAGWWRRRAVSFDLLIEEPPGQMPITTTYLIDLYDQDNAWIGALRTYQDWTPPEQFDAIKRGEPRVSMAIHIDPDPVDPCAQPQDTDQRS